MCVSARRMTGGAPAEKPSNPPAMTFPVLAAEIAPRFTLPVRFASLHFGRREKSGMTPPRMPLSPLDHKPANVTIWENRIHRLMCRQHGRSPSVRGTFEERALGDKRSAPVEEGRNQEARKHRGHSRVCVERQTRDRRTFVCLLCARERSIRGNELGRDGRLTGVSANHCRNKKPLIPQGLEKNSGGDGGIRTLDTGLSPYASLAGKCLRPLGHVSTLSCAMAGRTHKVQHHNFSRMAGQPDKRADAINFPCRGRKSCATRARPVPCTSRRSAPRS